MDRYSRHRPIPITTSPIVWNKKRGDKKQDTRKIGGKLNGENGLSGDAGAPGCLRARTRVRGKTHRSARKFAKGPVYLDQAAQIARLGAAPLLVWLAVRAHADFRKGALATAKWVADETGWSRRTVQDAVSKLEASGSLRRFGEELEVPEYAR